MDHNVLLYNTQPTYHDSRLATREVDSLQPCDRQTDRQISRPSKSYSEFNR